MKAITVISIYRNISGVSNIKLTRKVADEINRNFWVAKISVKRDSERKPHTNFCKVKIIVINSAVRSNGRP